MGRVNEKVDPCPGSLSIIMRPPLRARNSLQRDKPSPVPASEAVPVVV